MVGATPEVIRRHYDKLDQLAIAKRSIQRRLSVVHEVASYADAPNAPRRHRAEEKPTLDGVSNLPETVSA